MQIASQSLAPDSGRLRLACRSAACVVAAVLIGSAGPTHGAELVAPFVPTVMEDVELMLEVAGVGPGDYLIDLGSGDGRIVITAALRGALAHGIELDRELVELSRRRAREAEVEDQAAFLQQDVFEADLGAATVVTLYLMPEVNARLRPKLLDELRPGTRVVSNSFDLGDWEPDRHVVGRTSGGLFYWVVPARVGGAWRVSLAEAVFDVQIAQRFQSVELTGRGGPDLHGGVLSGDRISFRGVDAGRRYAFSGRVDGARMAGVVQVHDAGGSTVQRWEARRVDGAAR